MSWLRSGSIRQHNSNSAQLLFDIVSSQVLYCILHVGACGQVDRALDSRSQGLGFDSNLVMWKIIAQILFHAVSVYLAVKWWVSDEMKNAELQWLTLSLAAEIVQIFLQKIWDPKSVCSNIKTVNCTVCWTRGDIWTVNMYILIYLYIFMWVFSE